MFKYCKEYAHHEPIIKDDNIFKFSLEHEFFKNIKSDQVSDQVGGVPPTQEGGMV